MENELDEIALKHGTDKASNQNNLTSIYYKYFNSLKNHKLNILEIGVKHGASLRTWRDFFPNAIVHGIDTKLVDIQDNERIILHFGSQDDVKFLKSINQNFDIIIDDGSHLMSHQKISFETLFPLLNQNGLYIIEDLSTSYLQEYVNHPKTMISYLKDLIDYLNYYVDSEFLTEFESDLVHNIYSINFYSSICFIKKCLKRKNFNIYKKPI